MVAPTTRNNAQGFRADGEEPQMGRWTVMRFSTGILYYGRHAALARGPALA